MLFNKNLLAIATGPYPLLPPNHSLTTPRSSSTTTASIAEKRTWLIHQMVLAPEEHNDWVTGAGLYLVLSWTVNEPVMRLRRFCPV